MTDPLPVTTADDMFYPPVDGWSWVNQGSASVAAGNRGLVWSQPAVAANNLIGRTRPYTGTIIATAQLVNSSPSTAFAGHGLGFTSASGQVAVMYWTSNGNAFQVNYWNSATSFNSAFATTTGLGARNGYWCQVEDTGVNLVFRVSANGESGSFQDLTSLGRTAFLTGGPVTVGWWGRDNGGIQSWILARWDQ